MTEPVHIPDDDDPAVAGVRDDLIRTARSLNVPENIIAHMGVVGPGPWCPVCRQPVPETGFAWTFPAHGDGCPGTGRRVLDRDHGFVVDGRVVPEWESR